MGRRVDNGAVTRSMGAVSADISRSGSATQPHRVIGSVRSVTGPVAITRRDGGVDQAAIGSPIYRGDVIETGADGAVKIIFKNGAAFNLSADGRMVLDKLACDAEGQL